MKNITIVIAIVLCFSVLVGVSVSSMINTFGLYTQSIGTIIAEVLKLGGFPQAEGGYSEPLEIADLGVYADEFVGNINIRQYIIDHMTPNWIFQSGVYADLYTFSCETRVYPNYYYGNVETDGANLTYIKENIYSGRLIRIDYIINWRPNIPNGFTTTTYTYNYSVFVFPYENELRFLCFYSYDDTALLADGYNSIQEFYDYDTYDIYHPNANGERGRLVGEHYIKPGKGATTYILDGLLYTNVFLGSDAGIFKNFVKG